MSWDFAATELRNVNARIEEARPMGITLTILSTLREFPTSHFGAE